MRKLVICIIFISIFTSIAICSNDLSLDYFEKNEPILESIDFSITDGKNFDIFVSNLNYNYKNRIFDEYYITQITIKNSTFKTHRGITIGSDIAEIIKAYGYGDERTEDDNTYLIYSMDDKELQFTIDENQKVKGMVMLMR